MRVDGISWGTYWHSRDILLKVKGDHRDQVHSDRKILTVIGWGRMILVVGGQESQTSARDQQARVHSDDSFDGQVGSWSA
jgi:hypothetical protein